MSEFRRRLLKIISQWDSGEINYNKVPLTFKCITGGDLSIKNENGSYDRNFEYSLNDGPWTAFSLPKSSGVLLIATLSPDDTISFRRDNDNFFQAQFVSDSSLTFDIYGNLLSLQYGSAFNGQTALRNTSKQAFGYTFKGTNVVDASNLKLAAPTLSNNCYQNMFRDCVLLESAPELPATTLKSYCYSEMFKGCTNLVTAPSVLPATALQSHCYYEMFQGCSSLVDAPSVLPAATLAMNCYQDMFRYCSSLTSAPDLPATTLTKDCYRNMFDGCSSLIIAPELSATTLAQDCCRAMFYGCTSLTSAQELPATTLVQSCYRDMFYGCTALVNAPSLPATTLATDCYRGMFYSCSNLTVAPALPATTLADNCYYEMFRNCTALTAAPELKAATLVSSCYAYMFTGCSQLYYVKCLATDISASGCTGNWLASVSATGTFVKAASMSGWARNGNGIPAGWNILDDINDYTTYGWLQTDGSSYIDLGIPANANMKITGAFNYGTIPGWTSVDNAVLAISFGSIDVYMNWYRDSNAYMRIVGRANNFQAYTRLSSSFTKPYYCMRLDCSGSTYKNAIQYSVSTTRLQVPDLSTSLTSVSSANNSALTPTYVNNLYVFKANGFNNNNERTLNGFKCYGINIYENDVLTHRYIPVVKNNTGEAGLYDTINNSFFGNANPSGVLTAGY